LDTVTVSSWDEAYTASAPAPWDIGRPRPAFELNQPGLGIPSAQAWLAAIERT